MKTHAAVLWGGAPGLADRGDRPRPAQGAARCWSSGWPRACATPTSTSVTGDMVLPEEIRLAAGLPTTVPDHRRPRGRRRRARGRPGRDPRRAGRPRRGQLLPGLRPLPLVRDRPLEPVRPRRGDLRHGPDQRRDQPAPPQRRRTSTSWPRWARSPSTASSTRQSLVKVDPDLPLTAVALVSCGVTTGWGSAVHRAEVQPGRDGRRRRRRRRRHQRRAGGPHGRGRARSSPSTRSSSSRRRRSTSAPRTPRRRWRRRSRSSPS